MPPWAETQVAFAQQLQAPHASDDARMGIYRENVWLTLIDALSETYRAVHALVGETFFAQLARSYIAQHPPSDGDLNHYGAFFADFLQAQPVRDQLLYLPDVARYEWAWQRAYYAADVPPIDWQEYGQSVISASQLRFHPSFHLLDLQYDASAIWAFCVLQAGEGRPPNMQQAQHQIALYRGANGVTEQPLNEDEYMFLEQLARGDSIAKALAYHDEPTIHALLQLLFAHAWVIEIIKGETQ